MRIIFAIMFGLMLASCASQPSNPNIENQTESEGDSENYFIGPGDNIEIFVWRHPDLSRSVPVRPDGKISVPLVEDIVAVGKTSTVLARDIEEKLSKYIKRPQVNVIVTGFVGQFGEQIRVVGQAANPQSLSYRSSITLLDVIIEVGGLTEFASGNRAKIIRRTKTGTEEIPVRIHDLINKGQIQYNVEMKPGDILLIPESIF